MQFLARWRAEVTEGATHRADPAARRVAGGRASRTRAGQRGHFSVAQARLSDERESRNVATGPQTAGVMQTVLGSLKLREGRRLIAVCKVRSCTVLLAKGRSPPRTITAVARGGTQAGSTLKSWRRQWKMTALLASRGAGCCTVPPTAPWGISRLVALGRKPRALAKRRPISGWPETAKRPDFAGEYSWSEATQCTEAPMQAAYCRAPLAVLAWVRA